MCTILAAQVNTIKKAEGKYASDHCRYEIINDHAIGYDLAHYEQPRWTNIYAYKNGTYQLANGDFPDEFRSLYSEISKQLKAHPSDPELLKYLGILYEIRKQPKQALEAYKKSLKAFDEYISGADTPELKAKYQWETNDIKQRIALLR